MSTVFRKEVAKVNTEGTISITINMNSFFPSILDIYITIRSALS